jgi:hypothetical protein
MAKARTTSSGDRDVITLPIHSVKLMRLANCIALVAPFLLDLGPISRIDEHSLLRLSFNWRSVTPLVFLTLAECFCVTLAPACGAVAESSSVVTTE